MQTTTGQQWLDFCVMIGRDDWVADERIARGTYRTLHRDEIESVIDAWTSVRTTADIVELATVMRVPVAEVGNGANLPHFDHLVDGGWFATNRARLHAAVGAVPARWRRGAASVQRRADHRARHRAVSGAHRVDSATAPPP